MSTSASSKNSVTQFRSFVIFNAWKKKIHGNSTQLIANKVRKVKPLLDRLSELQGNQEHLFAISQSAGEVVMMLSL